MPYRGRQTTRQEGVFFFVNHEFPKDFSDPKTNLMKSTALRIFSSFKTVRMTKRTRTENGTYSREFFTTKSVFS